MASNPETIVTNRIRKLLVSHGAHFVKLSDSFTRGIPDSFVVSNRVVFIEYKVDRGRKTLGTDRTYKSLGLKGSQDHHIKAISSRAPTSAYVVTDTVKGDRLRVWRPERPHDEADPTYVMVTEGDCNFLMLMGLM